MTSADILIVGGGPAGLTAAIEAADAGADVLVLDENDRIGGQIHRQPSIELSPIKFGNDVKGIELVRAVEGRQRIRTLCNTPVWGVDGSRTVVAIRDDRPLHVTARCLVICTGAHDRPVPFPGWTLPGVMSAGAALTLIKGQRILPGRNVLLAGAGPLQLVLAKYLVDGGSAIAGLLEASSRWELYRRLPRLFREWTLLYEGIRYVGWLRAKGVRVRHRHTILSAEGRECVERATITRVDQDWRPIEGTSETLDVDAVVCGFGFVPSLELTGLLGCRHEYRESTGGWHASHDESMETSIPGVFVAGENTGIAGGAVAAEKGRIAGICAAHRLGYLTESEAAERSQAARSRLVGLGRFRAALDEIHAPRHGLLELLEPDTIVCRCEDVTAAMVVDAIRAGSRRTKDVKMRTRAGMGLCQGRMCATSVACLIARHVGTTPEAAGAPSIRLPARPVTLDALSILGTSHGGTPPQASAPGSADTRPAR